ncbi:MULTISPECIES: restriction endonuclease subunit S [Klebsiella]|uniref:restriction endonuclease subunit S n=1 Tax=Klebsiella TaxID=570 RepID=UPI000C2848E2|nr:MULTISPECIES: restriction endonuclease subunit S [Klebsiella]PJR55087.1 restriction endonuclease subunit S [Klebsiella sp. I-Nf8]PJX69341.1 restriction endonuclease subunit S [Klebsiella sp. G-Nf4]PJX76056.1 restriction endonuclease subunit S [Klebsiella sp. G2-16S-Nf13]PKJ74694.1 restriction endonuclease subunit S [Klebsiella sp. J-Nf11]
MNFSTERLEELCELIVDCPHSTPTWTDSGFVVLRNQNIRDGVLDLSSPSFTDEEGFKSRIKRATPKENDIVFTREAPMGEVCLIPEGLTCCLGQRQVLLRARENINPHFLFWALQSPYVQHQIFWNEGTGTTVSNVRIPFIKDLKIPRLVGMEDTIAFTLNSLAQKLSNNNKINRTLEQMAQALFKSWFVDFEPVKAKIAVLEAGGSQEDATLAAMTAISGKDADSLTVFEQEHPEKYAELKATAELFPSTMQESELGDIPAGWSSQRMSNIATLHYGKALKKTERIDGPYPVYGSGGITGSHNGYLVEGPSIIVGRKGSIGTIYWEDGKFHPIDTVYYVATKEEIPLSYLYYLMKTLNLPSMNTDAAVPGLNRDNVYRLEVLKPTQSILNKFDNHIATIRNGIQKNNNTIVSLVGLRGTLLPKLLSGEITLPEAEEITKEADYV